ncbi:hypothetical protein TNCV_264441 [Trichonephila clavipes]|nr:hypothetical protein TNCV_264441 [Trichonephila clavipes]
MVTVPCCSRDHYSVRVDIYNASKPYSCLKLRDVAVRYCKINLTVYLFSQKIVETLHEITSAVNIHLHNPISARTVQTELHASNLYGRVGIRKPLVTARHALQRRQWCSHT